MSEASQSGIINPVRSLIRCVLVHFTTLHYCLNIDKGLLSGLLTVIKMYRYLFQRTAWKGNEGLICVWCKVRKLLSTEDWAKLKGEGKVVKKETLGIYCKQMYTPRPDYKEGFEALSALLLSNDFYANISRENTVAELNPKNIWTTSIPPGPPSSL